MDAVCRATADGAVWIGHMRPALDDRPSFKVPAAIALAGHATALPECPATAEGAWQPVRYVERDRIGYLHFDFYNGAMSTADCRRLLDAYHPYARRSACRCARTRPERSWRS